MASHRALRALTKGANMLSGAASSSRLAAPLLRSTAVGFMRLASQPTVSARFYTSERARQHEAKVKKIEAVEQVAEMVEEAEAVLEEEYAIPTVLELATSESHTHNEDAVGKLFEMSPQLIDNLLPESASAAFAKEWKDIHDCVEDTSRGRAFVVTEGLHGLRKKILDSYNANSPLRILVRGQFGVGKSSALAATALACRQAERCVVYIPSAKELIDGSSIIMDMQRKGPDGETLYDTPDLALRLLNRLKATEESNLQLVPSGLQDFGVTLADVVDKGLKEPLQSSVAVAHIFETLARTKTISTTFLIDDIESLLSLSLYHTPLALGKDSTGFVPKRVPPRNLTVVRPLVDLLEEQGQTTASVVVSEGSHAKIGVFSKKHCSALIEIVTQPSAAGFEEFVVQPMTFENVRAKLLYLRGIKYIYLNVDERLAMRLFTMTSGYPRHLAKLCRAF